MKGRLVPCKAPDAARWAGSGG